MTGRTPKTWQKLTNGLPDDGKTGATVVTIHPENPDILYATMWSFCGTAA